MEETPTIVKEENESFEQKYKLDSLELVPITSESLIIPPPLFDFEKYGAYAPSLAKSLNKHMTKWGGIGLSANQVGLPFRVFTMGYGDSFITFFNPLIIGVSKDTVAMEESCLSIPGFSLVLARPKEVTMSWFDEEGKQQLGMFQHLGARVVLHEYDHMEGMLFTQHASHTKMQFALKKYKNKIKKEQIKYIKEMMRGLE